MGKGEEKRGLRCVQRSGNRSGRLVRVSLPVAQCRSGTPDSHPSSDTNQRRTSVSYFSLLVFSSVKWGVEDSAVPEVACWLLLLTLHGKWNLREGRGGKEREGRGGSWAMGTGSQRGLIWDDVHILWSEMKVVHQDLSEGLAPPVPSEERSPGQWVCLWFPYPWRPSQKGGQPLERREVAEARHGELPLPLPPSPPSQPLWPLKGPEQSWEHALGRPPLH